MDIDSVTDSVKTMQLTEPDIQSHERDRMRIYYMLSREILVAKQLLREPLHKKSPLTYYTQLQKVNVIKKNVSYAEEKEKDEGFREYAKTEEYQEMKHNAKYWLGKLIRDTDCVRQRFGIPPAAFIDTPHVAKGSYCKVYTSNRCRIVEE